jgi:hypothetical protein
VLGVPDYRERTPVFIEFAEECFASVLWMRQVATVHGVIIPSDKTREIPPVVLGVMDCCNYSVGVANGNKRALC